MKVTIATLAWSYKNYIRKCIESVLNQTFKDIEFFILDNGSTDGTKEIIEEYAAKDSRIRVYRREENLLNDSMWLDFPTEQGTGKYFMNIDCDDWLEPDCVERLVRIAEAGDFDIVATGRHIHVEATGNVTKHSPECKLIAERKQFAEYYPYYHQYFRTAWGKLIKMDIVRSMTHDERKLALSYGGDTMIVFKWMRKAKKFYLDDSALYHYNVHKGTATNTFNSDKIYCNAVLYNDAADFLSGFGEISPQNRDFLYVVYSNGITDVSNPLFEAKMTPEEKVKAYNEILCSSVTKEAYKNCAAEEVTKSRKKLLSEMIYFTAQLTAPLKEYEEIFAYYLPVCGKMISNKTAGLFFKEKALAETVLKDDGDLAAEQLADLAASGKYTNQYNIIEMLSTLSQNHPLLSNINDRYFFKNYSGVYLTLWKGSYEQALDDMTEILLNGDLSNETLIQLYLTVAALLERINEFVFGKIKLAAFYQTKRRYNECKAVLDDLADMGVEDNEDIAQIKADREYARFAADPAR